MRLSLHILLAVWITMACLLHVFAMIYPRLVMHQVGKNCSPNCQYRTHSVRKSCWYQNFLKPGETRELQMEMSISDCDGEFCCAFRMSLEKVEHLTKKLIARGYLPPPRSLRRRDEYPKRYELLVMSALYILGTGALF